MATNTRFMQGNEAIAHGALAAGARFYAGYPITPSSEVAEIASVELPKLGGVYIQMEDEISSIAAMLGASMSGKKSFTATSGPGFSLMQENLGVAVLCEIPCVLINVMRSGPSTGLATKPAQGDVMQSRWGTHGDHGMIVLAPSSVEDCYYLTIECFNLSERYRAPAILLADETVGHLRERADITPPTPEELTERLRPSGDPKDYRTFALSDYPNQASPMAYFGSPYRMRIPAGMHDEWGIQRPDPKNADNFIRHFTNKIEYNKKDIVKTREYYMDDAELVIIAYGSTARAAIDSAKALRASGVKAGVLQLVTIWPFATDEVTKACKQAKAVLVPEMNLGQIAGEVLKYAGGTPVHPLNRVDSLIITPGQISELAKEVMA